MAKTTVTPAQVQHIGRLANLELLPDQLATQSQNLTAILEYMERIQGLDVTNITGTAQVSDAQNVLRDDRVTPSLPQDKALSGSKKTHEGYFMVDGIFANKET